MPADESIKKAKDLFISLHVSAEDAKAIVEIARFLEEKEKALLAIKP